MKRKLYKFVLFVGSVIISPFYVVWRLVHGKRTKVRYNDIVDGFTNYTFPDERAERLAKHRASICASCPLAKYSKAVRVVGGKESIKEIKGMYCDACGCALSAKVRSMDSWCPKYKW